MHTGQRRALFILCCCVPPTLRWKSFSRCHLHNMSSSLYACSIPYSVLWALHSFTAFPLRANPVRCVTSLFPFYRWGNWSRYYCYPISQMRKQASVNYIARGYIACTWWTQVSNPDLLTAGPVPLTGKPSTVCFMELETLSGKVGGEVNDDL